MYVRERLCQGVVEENAPFLDTFWYSAFEYQLPIEATLRIFSSWTEEERAESCGGHCTAGSNCRAGKWHHHPHPSLLCLRLSFPRAKASGPEWILTLMNQTWVWICNCYLPHSSFPKPEMTNTAKNFPLQNIYYACSLSQGCSHCLLIQC